MSGHSKWSTIKRQKARLTPNADSSSRNWRGKSRSPRGKGCRIPTPTRACASRLIGRERPICRKTISSGRSSGRPG